MLRNVPITFKVSEEEKQLIADAAYAARVNVSQYIREAIEYYMEAEKKYSNIEVTVHRDN